ncbi:hypothetical protein ACUN0G_02830 [Pseudomonas sp. 32A]|uniref:hypothetical protein n=1 Tax=Pseudomonas sp. 32A TaxID=651185 RepID=UPI0040458E62
MADFLIEKVAYSEDGEHIEWVLVREDKGDKAGPRIPVPRLFIADLIRLGKAEFQTVVKAANGKLDRGSEVRLYDGKFLTTSPNKTDRDNLENLPTFEFPPVTT